MPITFKNGQFVYEADALRKFNDLARLVGQSSDRSLHEMIASTIIPPITNVVAYEEWTNIFFREYPVDLNNLPRIAVDNPSMIALYTSPTGEAMFVRPGRTTYSTISLSMIDAGLEIGWDDMAMAGWNIFERKVSEVGQELARKRDELGKTVIDAAVAAVAGHVITVTGGKMTKAGVDSVIKAASSAGWNLTTVVVHPTTFMDMTDWVWSSATHLWENPVKDAELLTTLRVANYGGLNWVPKLYCPTDRLYFSCGPEVTGGYRWTAGGLRTATDMDIKKKTDRHIWDQKLGHSLLNPYAIWALDITA
jgi:hypothetical protein